MPENREMFLEELSPEQQQEALANLTSTPAQSPGFDPVDVMSPAELAELSINSKGKDFDPVEYAASNPDKTQDPNTVAKLADTYGLLKQRGFKLKDVDLWEATKGFLHIFPAMAKWGGTALELGVVNPVARAVLPDQKPEAEREFEKIRAKKSAELVASTELGITGLGELAKKGAGKVSRLFGISKDPNEQDPQERVNDFFGAVGMAQQRQKISEGAGTATTAVLGGVVEDLAKSGIKPDPEVVAELAAGDPVTFLAFPGGIKLVTASGKTLAQVATRAEAVQIVTRLRQAQRAAARATAAEGAAVRGLERAKGTVAEMSPLGQTLAAPALTEAGQAATQASRAAGTADAALTAAQEAFNASRGAQVVAGAQQLGQRLVEPIRRAGEAVSGAVTRATDVGLGVGAGAVGTGLRTIEGVAKGVSALLPPITTPRAVRVVAETAGRAGKAQQQVAGQLIRGTREGFSPSLRLLSDVSRGVPTVAAGAAKGFLTLDIPLAAVSSETPADTAHMPVFGAFLGAAGRVPRAAGRVVQGQTIAPRAWGSEAAQRDYRHFSALDQANRFSNEQAADPARTQWLAAIREGLVNPSGAELYWVSDEAMLRDVLQRYLPGAEEAWLNEAVKQRALTLKLRDDAGVQRNVTILRDAEAAPHDAMHPFQDALGERAMAEIDQLVYDEYAPIWDQLGENYARQFFGSKGFAEYQARGEGWQEAILDLTSGSREWRNQLDPAQVDQVANTYLSREISAEVGDAVIRASGPEFLQNPSFPGKLARILGKTMVGLGIEPFEGVRTEGQGVPLRFEPTLEFQEAFRQGREGLVAPRRPDIGGIPPYPQRGGPSTRPAPTAPAAPTDPAEQATPEAAATEARAIAAEASETPTFRGQRSPREVLGEIAETIATGEGLKIDYRSAPGEPAGAVTSNRAARRAIIEAFRTMPQSARTLFEKLFFPDRVVRTGKGIQVMGWAPEVFAANAHKLAQAVKQAGEVTWWNQKNPHYEIDAKTGSFTESGWRSLYDDATAFSKNQLAGLTGAGEPLVVPQSVVERGFTQPARRGEAAGQIEQGRADVVSALFGIPIPKTPRVARGRFPRNLAGQEVSEATAPGRVTPTVEPRAPFAGEVAEEMGIAGRQLQEVNPARAEWEAKGVKPSMIEAIQRLNMDNIADVGAAVGATPIRGVEFTLQAGFQPGRKGFATQEAIRRENIEYRGTLHSIARNQLGRRQKDESFEDYQTRIEEKISELEASETPEETQARGKRIRQLEAEVRKELADERRESQFQPRSLPLESTITQIRDADLATLRDIVKNTSGRFGGGLTGFAYDLGAGLKDAAQLKMLDDARQFHKDAAKAALTTKDYDQAAMHGNKSQLFREAVEFATGEGSAGMAQQRDFQTFEPPLRGVKPGQSQEQAQEQLIGGQFQTAKADPTGKREAIRMAAIRLPDGTIHEGLVHGMAWQESGLSPIPANRPIALQAIEEGFMTTNDRFVNREEAYEIGRKAQQIEEESDATDVAKMVALSDERPALEAFSFNESRKFQPKPNKEVEDVAVKYAESSGIPYTPSNTVLTPKLDTAKKIADFYEAAKSDPASPEVKASYDALSKETLDQWNAIEEAGYTLEPWTGKGEPYKNSDEMTADVRDNKHLYFLKTSPETIAAEASNPLLAPAGVGENLVVNDVFRAVHDFFGHAKEGLQFGPKGELNAWRAHSEMFSPEAQGALAAETLAQNSWVNFGKHLRNSSGGIPARGEEGYISPQDRPFAEQKNIVIPEELIQEARGQSDAQFQPRKKRTATKVSVELPNAAKGEDFTVTHYSSQSGLSQVDPKFFGKGKATPTDLRGGPKSFFFVKGSDFGQDANIFKDAGLNEYESTISGAKLYDLRAGKTDDLGWRRTINREEADNIVEKAGYDGLILDTADGRQVVAMFKPVDVTEAAAEGAKFQPAKPKRDKVSFARPGSEYWVDKKGLEAAVMGHQVWAEEKFPGAKNPYGAAEEAGYSRVVVSDDAVYVNPSPKIKSWEDLPPSVRRKIEDLAFNKNVEVQFGDRIVMETPRPESISGAQFQPQPRRFQPSRMTGEISRFHTSPRFQPRGETEGFATREARRQEEVEYRGTLDSIARNQLGRRKQNESFEDYQARLDEKIVQLEAEETPAETQAREKRVRQLEASIRRELADERRENSQFQPRGETEGLPGFDTPREVLTPRERAAMSLQDLRKHFPEAVVPREISDPVASDIVGSPLYKRAGSESEAVTQFAKRLVDFAREYESDPAFEAGKKWYSDFTPMLKKQFGKDSQLMAELLAATSPNTGVETNYGYAFDALKSLREGRFTKIIPKFEEGLEKIADESWEKWYDKELKAGNVKSPPQTPSPAAFLAHWVDKFNLKPRQSNGKLYGQHSLPVLQVFARRWMELNAGPKTRNFVGNLLGEVHEATIDVWADRTMRWAGYEGFKDRWRILPENKKGVSDEDFAFSQKVFRAAAEELGMKPDDLQGALWFAEKKRWADNGWGRLDLGDFREEIKKTPLLEKGYEQRLSKQKAEKKAAKGAGEQLGLDVEPRFK